MTSRRNILKTGAALGGVAAFGAGFSETGERVVETFFGPKKTNGTIGRSRTPEMRVGADGALVVDPTQRVSYTMCMGCTTQCGVRVRIDTASETVVRVTGNPYSPLSTSRQLPMTASVRESFLSLSRYEEQGLAGRSTACGRGNAVLENMSSPYRVTMPLKRVGPRNSGKWAPISFEQLVKEVVEGGDLFGEGHVKGLRELRSFDPIDPEQPELGPKVNKVALEVSGDDGRNALANRFLVKAFGSINMTDHGAYCGGAYRAGSGAVFGDMKTMPHAKPDLEHAEFILFIGTEPAQAGNPFKRQGMQLAKARTDGRLDYVVVDPVLGNSDSMATKHHGRWVPITPGTDAAFALGMIRCMIDENRIDAKFLSQPNLRVAKAAGEVAWSNATHLVITEPGHPRQGSFLRASDLGLPVTDADRDKNEDAFVVIDPVTDAPLAHQAATGPAALYVERAFVIDGATVRVASALSLLARNARRKTIEEYAAICGVPAPTILGLAREFASHGKKAAASAHGGMMGGSGFEGAFAIVTLNTLVGNLNRKGGTFVGGGGFPPYGGPRYRMADFPGAVIPRGVPLSRNVAYEGTSEFKRKQAAGKPYAAQAPWYPIGPQLATEWWAGALMEYPYKLDALILFSSNPVYGIPGLRPVAEKLLGDPKKLPLFISIDPFINESNTFADYIVPEAAMYESWGFDGAWAGVPAKATNARWPVVAPKTARTADGQPICGDMFLIALAKALNLPGFGPGAIQGADGKNYPLEKPEDWYFRAAANIAFLGTPVGDATDDDIALSGVSRLMPTLRATLPDEEVRKVAFLYSRGGRFQPAVEAWSEQGIAASPFERPLQLWNEKLAMAKSAITGKNHSGAPIWIEPCFADGTPVSQHYAGKDWPLRLVAKKSVLQGSRSIPSRRLRNLHPENPIAVNWQDAEKLGIRSGETVRVSTPGGSVTGMAIVRRGIARGVIAIEHGYGHREFGARAHVIGGQVRPQDGAIGAGVSENDLGLLDPTRASPAAYVDPIAGTAVRHGLPARLERA